MISAFQFGAFQFGAFQTGYTANDYDVITHGTIVLPQIKTAYVHGNNEAVLEPQSRVEYVYM